jgi:hypothetical protein
MSLWNVLFKKIGLPLSQSSVGSHAVRTFIDAVPVTDIHTARWNDGFLKDLGAFEELDPRNFMW